MLPFSIGFAEIVIIFTVLLLVVGPKGIPQLARTVGSWVRMARRTWTEVQDVMMEADIKKPLVKPWEEVIKARDQAIESILAIDDEPTDAEVVSTEPEDQRAGQLETMHTEPTDTPSALSAQQTEGQRTSKRGDVSNGIEVETSDESGHG